MNFPIAAVLFIAGLFFGSFGNVISLRLQAKKKGLLWGRSECPQCKHQLRWWENIPLVSWVLLLGQCSVCTRSISWQYPAAELFFATLFALVGLFTPEGDVLLLIWRLIIVFTLGIIVLSDLRYMDIPDQVSLPTIRFLVLIALITTFIYPLSPEIPNIFTALKGAAVLFLFFSIQVLIPGLLNSIYEKSLTPLKNSVLALLVLPTWLILSVVLLHKKFEQLISKEGDDKEEDDPGWIGGGDFRIAVIMGLALGPLAGILAVLIGYLIGALASLPLVALTKKNSKSMIPLGPFLAIGMVIALLKGDQIVNWYLRLIGF